MTENDFICFKLFTLEKAKSLDGQKVWTGGTGLRRRTIFSRPTNLFVGQENIVRRHRLVQEGESQLVCQSVTLVTLTRLLVVVHYLCLVLLCYSIIFISVLVAVTVTYFTFELFLCVCIPM